jgi:hypothetical protein
MTLMTDCASMLSFFRNSRIGDTIELYISTLLIRYDVDIVYIFPRFIEHLWLALYDLKVQAIRIIESQKNII